MNLSSTLKVVASFWSSVKALYFLTFCLGGLFVFLFMTFWRWAENGYSETLFIGLAAGCAVCGFLLYLPIYGRLAEKRSILRDIPRLIAHVPDASAGHHIAAGVLLFSGLSLLAGAGYSQLFCSKLDWNSYLATSSGLMLGFFTLILSFWTLWQTKRLERLQGERIDRFDSLIKIIGKEIEDMIARYLQGHDRSSDLFRVCIVTNNPYFGVITYPNGDVTIAFSATMNNLCKHIQNYRVKKAKKSRLATDKGFRLRIVCADSVNLSTFNKQYFDAADGQAGLEEVNKQSESFLGEICSLLGAECVTRLPIVLPDVQFVIVGNVVYEFVLEAPEDQNQDRGTNICHTRRVEDQALADRYERHMSFFESLARMKSIDVP